MKQYIQLYQREYTYHYAETSNRVLIFNLPNLGLPAMPSACHPYDGKLFSSCVLASELEVVQQALRNKILVHYLAFKQYQNLFLQSGKRYVQVSKECGSVKGCTEGQLKKKYQRYFGVYLEYTTHIWVSWMLNELFFTLVPQMISEKAQAVGKQKHLALYLSTIAQPLKKASIYRLNSSSSMPKQKIHALHRTFRWLPYLDVSAKPLSLEEFKNYLSGQNSQKEKSVDIKQMCKDLQLNHLQQDLVKIGRDIAYLKDYRDELRRKGVYTITPLYKAISDTFRIAYGDFMYYTSDDVLSLFDGKKLSKHELARRKGKCLLRYVGRELRIDGPQEFEKLMKHLKTDTHGTSVSGMHAYSGKTHGIAKIVRNVSDLDKIKKGDILIAITTHPNYLPQMHLAKAFVTDEGGITCHAAIVAREMKKPCVVGTKTATKTFKDGDKVEVDAEKGVVRKI